MRVLAACSLGGAGHLNPLLTYLMAARDLSQETPVVGPPAFAELVGPTGFLSWPGGEPSEDDVAAPIREQLPILPATEALVLGNRELFGRLAARAMLPAMERVCSEWVPDLILREPAPDCIERILAAGWIFRLPERSGFQVQALLTFEQEDDGRVEPVVDLTDCDPSL